MPNHVSMQRDNHDRRSTLAHACKAVLAIHALITNHFSGTGRAIGLGVSVQTITYELDDL